VRGEGSVRRGSARQGVDGQAPSLDLQVPCDRDQGHLRGAAGLTRRTTHSHVPATVVIAALLCLAWQAGGKLLHAIGHSE